MKQIEVRGLTKSYINGSVTYDILRGIDFDVESGEFISICGPSGSGKTTLLYTLSGLESYQGGSVLWLGQELSRMKDIDKANMRAHEMGFVFQFYNLIPNLTVYENVMLASVIGKQKTKQEIMDVLALVGLSDQHHFYPAQLSGGMQQRVSIARALINEPKVLFADEPIGNLDHTNGILIMELFKQLNQTLHTTILMVTHNEDVTRYGTRVIHIEDGKVVKDERNS
jgi:putative ABC transport system ATP-binding protein